MNMAMDLVKFVLVLCLPHQQTYGLLILLSFLFICLGALSLLSYSSKQSGLSCCWTSSPVIVAKL